MGGAEPIQRHGIAPQTTREVLTILAELVCRKPSGGRRDLIVQAVDGFYQSRSTMSGPSDGAASMCASASSACIE